MLKKIFFKTLLCFLLCTSLNVFGQFLDFDNIDNEIFLIIGEIKSVDVNNPQRVSIRNPEIAGVDLISTREMVITAKQAGITKITVWDQGGEKVFYVTIYAWEPDVLKRRLKKIINKTLRIDSVYFRKNETTGTVMVMGEVNSLEKEQIEKILQPFIESVDNLLVIREETRMVEIECQILELTKSFADSLGFNWTGTAGASPVAMSTVAEAAKEASEKFNDVFRMVDFTRTGLDVQIMAAISSGKGKILARPKLLCLSGQEANFLVGGEIPVVTITSTSSGDTVAEDVEYKEYGVKLSMRPLVIDDNDIKLNIITEVKELSSEGQYQREDGTVIKAFTTRNISTVLRVAPGQGILISGLLKDKISKDDVSKVPGLGDIPILGALFRSKDYQEDQTELVISIIPRVIDSKGNEVGSKEELEVVSKLSQRKSPIIYPGHLQEEESLNNYVSQIQKIIIRSMDYPNLAEEAGWQGSLKVRLRLKYDGEVVGVAVRQTSGYEPFDNGVVDSIKSLSPYPPFPPSVDLEELVIDVPIVYKFD